MNDNQRIDILKIKEAAQRAKEYGMSISEYTIRRAIRSGQLPCRVIGRTYLISWKNFVEWATCEDGGDLCGDPAHLHREPSAGRMFVDHSHEGR